MLVKAFSMSLGMFSIFPVPKDTWNDKCAHLVIPFLPAVGAVIGLIWYAAARWLAVAGLPVLLHSAILLLLPFVLSGFLHIDGYMDTADAVFSRRPLDEKRRILKDPHAGSFAVAAAICLFLLQFCAVQGIISQNKPLTALILLPVISRVAAGLALLCLKPISENGYMYTFKANTKPRHTVAVVFSGGLCLALAWTGAALASLAVSALVAACVAAYLYRQLRGFSGDLCGCVITVAELAGLLCMAVI